MTERKLCKDKVRNTERRVYVFQLNILVSQATFLVLTQSLSCFQHLGKRIGMFHFPSSLDLLLILSVSGFTLTVGAKIAQCCSISFFPRYVQDKYISTVFCWLRTSPVRDSREGLGLSMLSIDGFHLGIGEEEQALERVEEEEGLKDRT